MQFRLTKNFATDCKIKILQHPNEKPHPLDDWFIDYMHAPRKKVAIITHAKSLFTFFISYEDAGGAKFIPMKFQTTLKEFFIQHTLPHLADEVDHVFSNEMTFTKTVDRKVLGHMNDFVRCSQPYPNEQRVFNCIIEAEHINNMPVMCGSRNATYPTLSIGVDYCLHHQM